MLNLLYRHKIESAGKFLVPNKLGRPKKMSAWTMSILTRQIEDKPNMTARELKEQNDELLSGVSLHTVRETLHRDLGCRCHWTWKKLIINDSQRKMRLHFARKYRDWPLDKWCTVLWSEESTFCVSGGGSSNYYRHLDSYSDTCSTQKTARNAPTLMVWGCFHIMVWETW